MEILNLETKEINQNGYHKTILTRDKIGALFTFPNGHVPEDCLACAGSKYSDCLLGFLIAGYLPTKALPSELKL